MEQLLPQHRAWLPAAPSAPFSGSPLLQLLPVPLSRCPWRSSQAGFAGFVPALIPPSPRSSFLRGGLDCCSQHKQWEWDSFQPFLRTNSVSCYPAKMGLFTALYSHPALTVKLPEVKQTSLGLDRNLMLLQGTLSEEITVIFILH